MSTDRLFSIEHETAIVWLQDPTLYPYVREDFTLRATDRQAPLTWPSPGRMVGYSVLAPDAPDNTYVNTYTRRIFWVANYDPVVPMHEAPPSAVDPRTIRPGVLGKKIAQTRGISTREA